MLLPHTFNNASLPKYNIYSRCFADPHPGHVRYVYNEAEEKASRVTVYVYLCVVLSVINYRLQGKFLLQCHLSESWDNIQKTLSRR